MKTRKKTTPYYETVAENKDKNTTLHLLHTQYYVQQMQGSLLACFHPCLVSVLFTGTSLFFCRNLLLSFCCCFFGGMKSTNGVMNKMITILQPPKPDTQFKVLLRHSYLLNYHLSTKRQLVGTTHHISSNKFHPQILITTQTVLAG